jgi:hypothetical protein
MIARPLSIGRFMYVGMLIAAPALADGFVTPSIGRKPPLCPLQTLRR